MATENIRLPGPDERLVLVGSTGSGKTQAGMWHLSRVDLHIRPWFIFDFKGDKMIGELNARELNIRSTPPKEAGLYVYRPMPNEFPLVIALLWKLWKQEECGIFVDEGFMISGQRRYNPAFEAILTQGRSKFIQLITLSQRPAWMSRFVFSEAGFFQVFRLNDERDYINIEQMVSLDIRNRLPSYYSHWYDVGNDLGAIFKPVPDRKIIIEAINRRIKNNIRML